MAPGPKPRTDSRTAAILTGDLVGSTEKPVRALERAMDALAEAARGISAWTGADTRFTRYRGDGWQMHVALPGLALRAALTAFARLRAADAGLATRAAIGIGRDRQHGLGQTSPTRTAPPSRPPATRSTACRAPGASPSTARG